MIFHALANEGNTNKVFIFHAIINWEDMYFMILLITLH